MLSRRRSCLSAEKNAVYHCAGAQGRLECRGGDCQCAAVPADPPGGLLRLPFGSLFTLYPSAEGKPFPPFRRPCRFLPSADGRPCADTAAQPVEATLRPRRAWTMAVFGGRGDAVPTAGGQRGQGHRMVPLPPLDSPKPSFALTHRRCAAKRGKRGLGSVRLSAYMQLSCPEFTLRGLPRITVRGHPVQGGSVLLRKAPLQSMMIPWSTRRPCGPLAFRRATGGSRVQRKMRGS